MSRRLKTAVDLPKDVTVVRPGGREYFYYQQGRGTASAGPRIRLPDDPRSAEFWAAVRQAQGLSGGAQDETVNALIDDYEASPDFLSLTDGSQDQYRRGLKVARLAWGSLPSAQLRPVHVLAMMDKLAATPGKANIFLGAIRALSAWARPRDKIPHSYCEGVKAYPARGGHKPWTPTQIAAAQEHLTGPVRRGVMLALYTGQRGSDVVRLGWTDLDQGGFDLRQRKTGIELHCPVLPELEAEMQTWERRPGPFLLQSNGRPYTRKLLDEHFADARKEIPALAGTTLHGLRSTAVIRLRRAGLSSGSIGDIIGMSLAMIERYCRFADKKASASAAVMDLKERVQNRIAKNLKTAKRDA